MMQSTARITAFGTHVPEARLTNQDLEKLVDTNDEWIRQRTGMKERRIAAEDEYASGLAFKAVKNLMNRSGKLVEDVDFILVATSTPDYVVPSVASHIQHHFGIEGAGALDISAACAGFAYALHLANSLVTSGLHAKILVVASETLSKVTDYTDRSTCILFGDGAAAVLVEKDLKEPSFIASHLDTDGSGGSHVYLSNLADQMFGEDIHINGKMVQNGREVYKWATRTLPKAMDELLKKADMTAADIDWFVPHSSNMRMIESICEKSGFPVERTLTSVEYYGNTSAVSIPLALQTGIEEGRLKNGDLLLIYGFGGGLTHAGLIIRWDLNQDKK